MKKSQLVQLIKEELGKGWSPQVGKTHGGTAADFRNILTKMAKDRPEEHDSEEQKAKRGNAILDKANPENVARILKGETPLYKNESVHGETYVTNLRPQGSWGNLVNVNIYRSEQGGYDLELTLHTVAGRGMSQVSRLKFADQAIPMKEFTAEHVLNRIGTVYKLSDQDKQELAKFVNSIPTKLS